MLNLGNVGFDGGEESSSLAKNDEFAIKVSELLGIDLAKLDSLLCTKSLVDPITKLKIQQEISRPMAEFNRETFSKIIYDSLFDWLVARVNVEIKKPIQAQAKNFKSIGLLDIFGFEIFESNSFEQLCINFTNEKLQQHFNSHMFKLEQQEYSEERIDWTDIAFLDNLEVINLVEKRPACIFSYLDDQGAFATGSDKKFLEQIQSSFAKNPRFLSGPKTKHTIFGIAHFAGEVYYDVTRFVEKNRNSKNKDMDEVMTASSFPFIAELFAETNKLGAKKGKAATNPQAPGSAVKIKSVSGHFLDQLEELIKHLNESASLYIRCIKPNNLMKAHVFQAELVCKQLRCAGMLEAIRIRRLGFPVRRPFESFYRYYKTLFELHRVAKPQPGNYRAAAEQFIKALDRDRVLSISSKALQVGKTKVFMKEHAKSILDSKLEQSLVVFVTRIQRAYIKHRIRTKLRNLTRARLTIQRWYRRFAARRIVKATHARRQIAVSQIQRLYRSSPLKKRLDSLAGKVRDSRLDFEMRLTEADEKTARRVLTPSIKDKKQLIKEKFSNMIKHSTYQHDDMTPDLSRIYPADDENSLEDDPRFMQLVIENQRLLRLLENARAEIRPVMHSIPESAVIQIEQLRNEIVQLHVQLKEKDQLLRRMRQDMDGLKHDNVAKDREIEKLKQEANQAQLDEEIFDQLERVSNIIHSKEKENETLKRKVEDLKHTLRSLRDSPGDIDTSQDHIITSLRRQIEQLQSESVLRESQYMNEGAKVGRLESSRLVLKDQAECCRNLVHDLVKLIKFKDFESRIIKKKYEEGIDNIQELEAKYVQMKPQEQIVTDRYHSAYIE